MSRFTYLNNAIFLKADLTMKDDFHLLTLEKFWIKRFLENLKVASLALQTLVPFSSTYICEKGFSALVLIKSKQRNCLRIKINKC